MSLCELQISFPVLFVTKNSPDYIISGNFDSEKVDQDEVFYYKDMLHSILSSVYVATESYQMRQSVLACLPKLKRENFCVDSNPGKSTRFLPSTGGITWQFVSI